MAPRSAALLPAAALSTSAGAATPTPSHGQALAAVEAASQLGTPRHAPAQPPQPRAPRGEEPPGQATLRPTLREMEQQPPAPLAPWQCVAACKATSYLKQANEPAGPALWLAPPAPHQGRPGRRRTRSETWPPSRPSQASPCRQREREDPWGRSAERAGFAGVGSLGPNNHIWTGREANASLKSNCDDKVLAGLK